MEQVLEWRFLGNELWRYGLFLFVLFADLLIYRLLARLLESTRGARTSRFAPLAFAGGA